MNTVEICEIKHHDQLVNKQGSAKITLSKLKQLPT